MSRWTFIFRPEDDGPPVEIHSRRLLKLALRACRLRCIDVKADEPRQTHGDERTANGSGIKAA